MITPAMLEAPDVLSGAEYRLFGKLHSKLTFGEYRTLKLWPLAKEMKMNKATVAQAMNRLVRLGYVREGSRQEQNARCFMLVFCRGDSASST